MKIVKNFLDKEYFEKLKNQIVDNDAIPFYFQATVAHKDDAKDEKQFYFTHVCYNDHVPNSNLFELFKPLVKQINCKSLIRIKINCYPRTDELLEHYPHIDYDYKHKGLVLSLNTCDGGTRISKKFIPSVENQALFFDPNVKHNSTTCTDKQARFNININYL
tara:strand:- start:342 stop:827 length:486 start_codon:yes stop_codon:yes gene_type:complete